MFFHELGHYLIGRLFGVGVDAFSIGFGPQIAGFQRKGTYYRIGILPLGGYVKFKGSYPGEEVEDRVQGKELLQAGKFQRMLIAFAGPLANILMAVAIFFILLQVGIEKSAPVVGHVRTSSVAEEAGFELGDRIVSVDGEVVLAWDDFGKQVKESPGKELLFKVERLSSDSKTKNLLDIKVTPMPKEGKDLLGRNKTIGAIGIASAFESPIVYSNQGSLAEKAGIKTGDWLKSFKVLSDSDVIYHKDIKYFEHFQQALFDIQTSKIEAGGNYFIEIEFISFDREKIDQLDTKSSKGKALTSNQKIDLLYPKNSLRAVKINLSDLVSSQKNIHASIGLESSHLVVRDSKESLSNQLLFGDRVIEWENKPVDSIYSLYEILGDQKKQDVQIKILRLSLIHI